jgi:hypothetical protein
MMLDWWYEPADSNDLFQGDFIQKCPLTVIKTLQKLEPNEAEAEGVEYKATSEIKKYDVIVMSQSCDIAHEKLKYVLVCPYWPLSRFQDERPFYKDEEGFIPLSRGNVMGYLLLEKCHIPKFEKEHLVVSFRHVQSVPFTWLKEFIRGSGTRIRLKSPYREYLSQAFAIFFMRVGLPRDIQIEESLYIQRLCVSCQKKVSQQAKFCENCGAQQ